MLTAYFRCPGCGQKYRFGPHKAGKPFSCTRCGAELMAPQVQRVPATNPVLAEMLAPPDSVFRSEQRATQEVGTAVDIKPGDPRRTSSRLAARPASLDDAVAQIKGLDETPAKPAKR